jgi:predicted metal-dependent peptidase
LSRYERVGPPFDRATRAARTGRIALAVDTSGSIDESLLKRFVAEVAAALEKAEPPLRLIVCDADIHNVPSVSGILLANSHVLERQRRVMFIEHVAR